MKKTMKKMLCILTVCILCLTMTATSAFAYGKRLNALSKDEVFECIWNLTSPGLEASLMYEECKTFVEQLEMPNKNYYASDGYNDFVEWYESKNGKMEIHTYNEKVIEYLKEHPGTELMWSSGSSKRIDGKLYIEYTVYDLNILVDKTTRTLDMPQMQYNSNNISALTVWTYDVADNQFIGKDINGNTVKKVYAYSKPYGVEEMSSTSETVESSSIVSNSNASKIESSVLTEPVTASDTADHPVEESAIEESTVIESSTSEAESRNNDNTTTVVIIVISGIVIAAVFVFLIIRQKKKRTV